MQLAFFISQLPPPNPNAIPLPPGLNQLPTLEGLSSNASETLNKATIASINVYQDLEKRWNQTGLRHWLTFGAFMGLCSVDVLTIVLTTIAPEAANAQFFKNAETWMKGKFTGADKAIEIIFNVLRGLFLIYLGISLVKVVQAGRQDQDWQDLARTPLIIVIAVVLGDILATFIVGTA